MFFYNVDTSVLRTKRRERETDKKNSREWKIKYNIVFYSENVRVAGIASRHRFPGDFFTRFIS